ncbi:MAG: ferredoxin [Sphingorhabdus sp.]
MKLITKIDLCVGHARCQAVAPDLVVLDENGYNDQAERDVPPELEQQARRAAKACPEGVISIVE